MEAASKGQISGAVLVDLSAAFDLVPHDLLLKKLEIYGFKESYTEILKSYLSERSQAVWIDHCMSEYLPVDVGVPQGSILGPLMFLIYINDLSSILDCDASQYADDTTLSSSDYTITSVSANLSRSCDKLSNWMCQNRFKLNSDKTHVLTLGTDKKLANPQNRVNVIMDGVQLKESDIGSKYLLGCQMQANMKWNIQYSN